VKADAVAGISKKISAQYLAKTGSAASIFSSRPAAGATILKES
jgi:galactokinase